MFELHGAQGEGSEQQNDYSGMFLSIGDLMSGLMMIFALLFIVVQIQIQKVEQERKRLELELQAKIEELKQFEDAFNRLPLVILAEIENQFGGNNVEVDPKTGDVSIGDRILFDEGSAVLEEKGKTFLRQFIPLYSKVIFSDPEFEAQIAHVVIEGHTSSKGSDKANRALSLNRALAVSNFIFSDAMDFPTRQQFQKKVLSAGRGEVDARQDIDYPSDRRVLFRSQFRRQDFSALFQQQQQLEQQLQEGTQP